MKTQRNIVPTTGILFVCMGNICRSPAGHCVFQHLVDKAGLSDQFEIESHSYFESEGDQDFKLDKAILENELWTQLRIDPASLPTGTLEMIPSLEFITSLKDSILDSGRVLCPILP